MKKNVFALSVAVALAGLAGAANAQEVPFLEGNTITASDAASFVVNPDGIGHIQLVPYYSTQGSRNTLLNIINTDSDEGKVVKVRFRGARNSDDVFDFYVFLSPGDVWRARVYRDGETTKLESADNSCTWPLNFAANGGSAFQTSRVFKNLETEVREGYIEILTAADIPKNTDKDSLYKAIKHVNGVAPCTEAVIEASMQPLTTPPAALAAGFANPSTGLIAQWAISDVETKATTSGVATSLLAVQADGKTPALGNIVVAPQTNDPAPATWSAPAGAAIGTADPLFTFDNRDTSYFDYPDLSTPYLGAIAPTLQANKVSSALAVTEVINEFATVDADLQTDWVFSLPTRRYGVTIDYTGGATGGPIARINAANEYFGGLTQAALDTSGTAPAIVINVATKLFDDEENTASSSAIISPGTPVRSSIRGEVNVFSFNKAPEDSLLGAVIAAQNMKTTIGSNVVKSGWATVGLTEQGTVTAGNNTGLPVIGYATVGSAGNAMSFTWPHRYNRAVK